MHRTHACGQPLVHAPSLADLATEAARLGRLLAAALDQEPIVVGLGFRHEVSELLTRLNSGDSLAPRLDEALDVLAEQVRAELARETHGTRRVIVAGCDQDGDRVLGYATVLDRSSRGDALAVAADLLIDYRTARHAALDRAAGERASARLGRP